MLAALRKLFVPKPPEAVDATYIALVAAARNPFFYTELKVPDTIDGRFELIVLHLFLLQHRLLSTQNPQHLAENQNFARFLSEAFFADMDNSLRELGVADTGVSKRIKKMGKSYHGSLQAYTAGLSDEQQLNAALARNLYGTVEQGDIGALVRMARVVRGMHALLLATDTALITAGTYQWPAPEPLAA